MNKIMVVLDDTTKSLSLDDRIFFCDNQEQVEERLKTYCLPFDEEEGIYSLNYGVYVLDAVIEVEKSVSLNWGLPTCI